VNKFRDRTLKHFDELFLGNTPKGELPVLWPSRASQLLRFRTLAEIDDLNDKTILDVGCGFGEFYYWLVERGVQLKDYVGIDLHPDVIRQAREAHPELKLSCTDILENDFQPDELDYVIASGLFNVELDDWDERTGLILDEMFRISKMGVSVNFLKPEAHYKNPKSHYVKIADAANLAERYTNRYIIRCDYKDNDFTLYLHKVKRETS